MDFIQEDVVVNLNQLKAKMFDKLTNIARDDNFSTEENGNLMQTTLFSYLDVLSMLEPFKVQ